MYHASRRGANPGGRWRTILMSQLIVHAGEFRFQVRFEEA